MALRSLTLIAALGLLSACSDAGVHVVTARSTCRRRQWSTRRRRPATTTTVPDTAPPTTRPPTTTSIAPATTTTELPVDTCPRSSCHRRGRRYDPLPGVPGVAALTNVLHPELENVAALAVKIDNHPRARPQWSLSLADVVFEENVESLTRFIAIFHSRLPSVIGPIRSARTSDLNILAAFNRPVLAWSGGNKNVTAVVRSAASSGILVNISAQSIGRCYRRESGRKAPHNLVVAPGCALDAAPSAGPARAPWTFDDAYVPAGGERRVPSTCRWMASDVAWVWDSASGQYLRAAGRSGPRRRRRSADRRIQRGGDVGRLPPEPGRCTQSGSADPRGGTGRRAPQRRRRRRHLVACRTRPIRSSSPMPPAHRSRWPAAQPSSSSSVPNRRTTVALSSLVVNRL